MLNNLYENAFQPCAVTGISFPSRVTIAAPSSGFVIYPITLTPLILLILS